MAQWLKSNGWDLDAERAAGEDTFGLDSLFEFNGEFPDDDKIAAQWLNIEGLFKYDCSGDVNDADFPGKDWLSSLLLSDFTPHATLLEEDCQIQTESMKPAIDHNTSISNKRRECNSKVEIEGNIMTSLDSIMKIECESIYTSSDVGGMLAKLSPASTAFAPKRRYSNDRHSALPAYSTVDHQRESVFFAEDAIASNLSQPDSLTHNVDEQAKDSVTAELANSEERNATTNVSEEVQLIEIDTTAWFDIQPEDVSCATGDQNVVYIILTDVNDGDEHEIMESKNAGNSNMKYSLVKESYEKGDKSEGESVLKSLLLSEVIGGNYVQTKRNNVATLPKTIDKSRLYDGDESDNGGSSQTESSVNKHRKFTAILPLAGNIKGNDDGSDEDYNLFFSNDSSSQDDKFDQDFPFDGTQNGFHSLRKRKISDSADDDEEYLPENLSTRGGYKRRHYQTTGFGNHDRKRRKMQQNREAAVRYRDKKRVEQEVRNAECAELEKRNAELTRDTEHLEQQVKYIRDILRELRSKKKEKRSNCKEYSLPKNIACGMSQVKKSSSAINSDDDKGIIEF